MDWLAHLLTDVSSVPHIILVYSLVITVGALLGRIRLFGVSLGVTFVLFAALAAGHFGFTVNPSVLYFLRDFGLTIFVYFIGLQVGPSFFSSFKSGGMTLNLLTVLQVFLGVAVTIALYFLFKDVVSLPQMLGVHYGAVTNTPGLGATRKRSNSSNTRARTSPCPTLRLSARASSGRSPRPSSSASSSASSSPRRTRPGTPKSARTIRSPSSFTSR